MDIELNFFIQSIAWPAVLLLAWAIGDMLYTRWQIPRVSSYVAVGMLVGTVNLPDLTPDIAGLPFVANVALSLVLFELGYRINLRSFRANPWVLLAGVAESLLTFAVVFWATGWLDDIRLHVRLAVAALAMASSPAGILRVVHELRSAGQVTERVMHLTAINCLLSVLALKLVMGSRTLRVSGDWMQAAFGSVHVLATSVAVGMLLGFLVPKLLKGRSSGASDGATLVFALSVLLLVTAASGLKLSPLLAALTFGIVARERRVRLAPNAAQLRVCRRLAQRVPVCVRGVAAAVERRVCQHPAGLVAAGLAGAGVCGGQCRHRHRSVASPSRRVS